MAEKDGVNAMAQAPSVPLSGPKLDNRRVLAAIIDLVVVGAGWAVIMAAAGVLGEPASGIGGGLLVVGLGWALYYYFACESGGGQTLGKRVMKIRVVGLDGRPAGMREIALRTVLRLIDGLFFYLVGLIVMIATGERRGRLGDLVGATMIVAADAPARAVAQTQLAEAPEAPRVPIAESGPAFAEATPVAEVEEPVAEAEPAPEPQGEEPEVEEAEVEEPVAEAEPAPEPQGEEPEVEEPEVEEPVAEAEPAPEPQGEEPEVEEPVAEAEPAPEPQGEEPEVEEAEAVEEVYDISDAEPLSEVEEVDDPEVASPSLVELASDVSAVTEDPEREVEEEDDEPLAAEADDEEPAAEEEPKVRVKSVETVSAIDLVMQDAEAEESSAKARPS